MGLLQIGVGQFEFANAALDIVRHTFAENGDGAVFLMVLAGEIWAVAWLFTHFDLQSGDPAFTIRVGKVNVGIATIDPAVALHGHAAHIGAGTGWKQQQAEALRQRKTQQ